MLRELFDGTCRVIPVHIEWKMLDLANDKEKTWRSLWKIRLIGKKKTTAFA